MSKPLESPSPRYFVYRTLSLASERRQRVRAPATSIPPLVPEKFAKQVPEFLCCFNRVLSWLKGFLTHLLQYLLKHSKSITFPVSKDVAVITPFTEVKPRFCQVPSKAAAISRQSSFRLRTSSAACLSEHSLTSVTAESSHAKHVCPVCGGRTNTETKLQFHMAKAHNYAMPESINESQ
ncbi:hypothetical protein J6590_059799 [Homalodisca vitripennis]|nr:hypothetical protein J6590_059799 [Homalodisca vitripennis]